jgi:GT2 family glycosyltransferase
MAISIVVLTYNRVHLLRQCVENVISRASSSTTEILVWNNGSSDGTRDYLDSLEIPRLRVVHNDGNLGLNAYDPAIRATSGEHIVTLDEDVIDAPTDWDETLLHAFELIPDIGFLASNLANNPHDVTSQIMYGENAHLYDIVERNGLKLKIGPVGGWCGMTSREIYSAVGGIGRNRRLTYWHWDGQYLGKIHNAGYASAILNDLELTHAGGEYYSAILPEKREFWRARSKRATRRLRVKRVLMKMPLVPSLNARFGWFQPPS